MKILFLLAILFLLIPIPTSDGIPMNARVVDEFGNSLDKIYVDQKFIITRDVANGADEIQPYVYIVQIKNDIGQVIDLKVFAGMLSSGQSYSTSIQFTITELGYYTVNTFVWESFDNPFALTSSVSMWLMVHSIDSNEECNNLFNQYKSLKNEKGAYFSGHPIHQQLDLDMSELLKKIKQSCS